MSESTKPLLEGSDNDTKRDVSIKVSSSPGDVKKQSPLWLKLFSALFYGTSSFLIMMINKTVLTVYGFPSFQVLGLGQMVASIIVLLLGKMTGLIKFPRLTAKTFTQLGPIPFFFLGNLISGLGGTKELSLPMVVVLRRFTSVITMAGEFLVLSIVPSWGIQISVYIMMAGAIVAALNDLAFNFLGYTLILINDLCTAGNNVFTKRVLNRKADAKNPSEELGKYGLIFYNNLFMILPVFAMVSFNGELDTAMNFEGFSNVNFCFQFFLSMIFGFVLLFSQMMCVQHNSPLTTNIVGCLKNVVVTYCGMIFGGDYVFSILNFLGLNLSVVGSLLYTYVTFRTGQKKKQGAEQEVTKQ